VVFEVFYIKSTCTPSAEFLEEMRHRIHVIVLVRIAGRLLHMFSIGRTMRLDCNLTCPVGG
jgi:hypothetical protein